MSDFCDFQRAVKCKVVAIVSAVEVIKLGTCGLVSQIKYSSLWQSASEVVIG